MAALKGENRNAINNMKLKDKKESHYMWHRGVIQLTTLLINIMTQRHHVKDGKAKVSFYYLGFNKGLNDAFENKIHMEDVFLYMDFHDGAMSPYQLRDINKTPRQLEFLRGYYNGTYASDNKNAVIIMEKDILQHKNLRAQK